MESVSVEHGRAGSLPVVFEHIDSCSSDLASNQQTGHNSLVKPICWLLYLPGVQGNISIWKVGILRDQLVIGVIGGVRLSVGTR